MLHAIGDYLMEEWYQSMKNDNRIDLLPASPSGHLRATSGSASWDNKVSAIDYRAREQDTKSTMNTHHQQLGILLHLNPF